MPLILVELEAALDQDRIAEAAERADNRAARAWLVRLWQRRVEAGLEGRRPIGGREVLEVAQREGDRGRKGERVGVDGAEEALDGGGDL